MVIVRTVGEIVGSLGVVLALSGAFLCLACLQHRLVNYGREDMDAIYVEYPIEKYGLGSVIRGAGLYGLGVVLYSV